MNIKEMIKSGNVEEIVDFARNNDLVIHEGKLVARDDTVKGAMKERAKFMDGRQQCRKILF